MPFKLLKNCWRIGYMPFVFVGKRKRKLRLYRPHLGQVRKQAVNLKRVALLLIHCAIFFFLIFFLLFQFFPLICGEHFWIAVAKIYKTLGEGSTLKSGCFIESGAHECQRATKGLSKRAELWAQLSDASQPRVQVPFFFFFFCNPDPSIPQLCDFVDIPGLDSGFLGGSGGGDTPRRFLFLRNK